MNTQTRISLVIGLVVAIAVGAFLFLAPGSDKDDEVAKPVTPPAGSDAALVHDDSLVLGEKGSSDVTLVEFVDFQCPSCAAMHPVVDDLREKYEGKVTFVLRQFPLPSHPHARPAALAVEAAALQDKHTEMAGEIFSGQQDWSPLDGEAAAEHFRGLAEKLDLDLDAYDEALEDPALEKRLDRDVADGTALGVNSTPTLFVNGVKLQLQSYDQVEEAIVEALGDGVDA